MKIVAQTSFVHIQLLSSTNWQCCFKRWDLHLRWCCHNLSNMHNTSPNMFYIKIHDKNKWKEELPWSMPSISIPPFSNQGNVYTNTWMSFYMSLLIIDLEGTPLSILVIFFHQQISSTLQMMKVSSILNWEIAKSLATYKLSLFPTHFPFPPSTFCKQ